MLTIDSSCHQFWKIDQVSWTIKRAGLPSKERRQDLSDINLATPPNCGWLAIEHWTEQGLCLASKAHQQTLPPLALAYKHRTVESGKSKIEIKRLHLILTAAAELPGARSFAPLLRRLVKDNYDQRHQVTLPHQYTDELLLWAYALDGKQHAMFWLSPASEETNPFSPVLQHWQSAVPIRADILPRMHFFDAWRIVPTMQIEPDDHEDLDSFEEVLPPCEKWEFRTQTDARTDAQLAREQTLQARAQNKTSAQMASKIAQVHKLTTLLAERVPWGKPEW